MKISIGCDHAAWELKEKVKQYLFKKSGISVDDKGCYSSERCDYPDFGHAVAKDVTENKCDFGILICGSGNGINMTANKWSGVRSALCWNSEIANMARLHNDANILTLPGRYISENEAFKCVDEFLNTGFEGGRHTDRINKIPIQIKLNTPNVTTKNGDFTIEKTTRTPHITLTNLDKILKISGRSMPENSMEFYKPLFAAIDNYKMDSLSIDIDLEYFNSTSSKCIYNLIVYAGHKFEDISVNWYHDNDDDDMVDYIKDIGSSSGVKIKIIEKINENN